MAIFPSYSSTYPLSVRPSFRSKSCSFDLSRRHTYTRLTTNTKGSTVQSKCLMPGALSRLNCISICILFRYRNLNIQIEMLTWARCLYASIDSVHQRPMNMLVKWPSTPTQALSVDANSSDYVALASIVYNAMENGHAAWYDIALDFGSAWSMQRGWRQRLSFFSVVVSASSVVEHVNFVKHKTNCGDGEVI